MGSITTVLDMLTKMHQKTTAPATTARNESETAKSSVCAYQSLLANQISVSKERTCAASYIKCSFLHWLSNKSLGIIKSR